MNAREVAASYFAAWDARDADAFRSLLADDVTFAGVEARAAGVEQCVAGFRRMTDVVSGVEVRRVWVDGDDAIVWFEVQRPDEAPMPAANWMHVQDGRVTSIRVTFDLLPP